MFEKHVSNDLSAYVDGQLAAAEANRVAGHLLGCARCRAEYESVRLGARLARRMTRASAPDELWASIEAELDARERKHRAVDPDRAVGWAAFGSSFFGWRTAAALAVVIAFAAVLATWRGVDGARGWVVVSLDGAPIVGSSRLASEGELGVGEALETDASSRARIDVADIGRVDVGPNSRVRLVGTGPDEHRLALDRGSLKALVVAPPRLFVVDTPSAVAVDYGCAYTLTVDDSGATLLRVTAGWVALVRGGRESMVPSGAACATRPGIGPGTPYFEDASDALRAALERIDFEGASEHAVSTVLAEARERDAITLWHLLPRVEGDARARVYDRLAELVPPPESVTREAVLALDRTALDAWGAEAGARAL